VLDAVFHEGLQQQGRHRVLRQLGRQLREYSRRGPMRIAISCHPVSALEGVKCRPRSMIAHVVVPMNTE
jgi:hypothetical protein